MNTNGSQSPNGVQARLRPSAGSCAVPDSSSTHSHAAHGHAAHPTPHIFNFIAVAWSAHFRRSRATHQPSAAPCPTQPARSLPVEVHSVRVSHVRRVHVHRARAAPNRRPQLVNQPAGGQVGRRGGAGERGGLSTAQCTGAAGAHSRVKEARSRCRHMTCGFPSPPGCRAQQSEACVRHA